MTEMVFCYCCRIHHPKEQMRRFTTRAGSRWRCVQSINAASRSVQERDSFGKRQTAMNQESTRCTAEFSKSMRRERLKQHSG